MEWESPTIVDGYRHFKCGSFAHASGECHQQSRMCRLAEGCREFRDTVLHGVVYGLDNDQTTNAVLALYDDLIGSVLAG